MNPNDYYFHSFKQIGAQIDRINKFYQSPIADFAKRQQALYENMGSIVRQHYSNYATDVLTSTQQVLSMCGQTALAAGLQTTDNTLHTLINSYPKICGADFSELFRVSAVAAAQNTISPISNSLAFQNAAQIGAQLVCGIEPLTSALNAIRITPAYVEIPAELIPDDFEYDKKLNPSTHRGAIIKLSPVQTQFLIGSILFPLILWLASYIMSLSPTAWQKQYHQEEMENDAKLIQQNEAIIQQNKIMIEQNQTIIEQNQTIIEQNEANQPNDEMIEIHQKQYEACLKGLETLNAIYNKLNSESISPEADLMTSYTECHSADAQSNADQVEPVPVSAEPVLDSAELQPSTTQDSPAENTQSSKSE